MCEQLAECLLGVYRFTDTNWDLIKHQCDHIVEVIITLVHVPNGLNKMSHEQVESQMQQGKKGFLHRFLHLHCGYTKPILRLDISPDIDKI